MTHRHPVKLAGAIALVIVNRPSFTLNPTGCTRKTFQAEIWGGGADPFSTADDSPVSRTARFQAASCGGLKFKPSLSLKLKGGTRRGAHMVDFDAVGRIDSSNARIRTSFETIPDAPISKFVLEMQGAKKGLIVNSRNLCAHPARAIADFTAQNGKSANLKPVVKATGCSAKH